MLTFKEVKAQMIQALKSLEDLESDWRNEEASLQDALRAAEKRNKKLAQQRAELEALLQRLHGDE